MYAIRVTDYYLKVPQDMLVEKPVNQAPLQIQLLQVALGEAAQSEVSGPAANLRIIEYLRAADNPSERDETPWCSAFLCWCAEQVGIPSTRNALARSWLKWGKPVPLGEAQVGDVVVFGHPTSSWKGHVGLFLAQTPEGVVAWGGNQSNTVNSKLYTREVLGIRRFEQ